MPVNFREYEDNRPDSGLPFDPDTHAYHILSFLGEHPETGFKPAEIADRAACSTNAARKHLSELLDMGVVREAAGSDGTRYVRNEAYIRWRRANELATTHTVDALLDTLEDLQHRDEQFRAQFDAPVPEDVELPEEATHAELEERLEAVSEWATVRESIDCHREALRIARMEGGRLTA